MHLNYHFFKFLCPQLSKLYRGRKLLSCFSQGPRELLLELDRAPWIRLHQHPPAVVLSFPEDFRRARQNTRNLFGSLVGQRITEVEVILFDRTFVIHFENRERLLFKMHGNRSNVLLYPAGEALPSESFLSGQKEDLLINYSDLAKSLDLSYESFLRQEGNASKFLPSLGAIPRAWLKERGYPEASLEDKWGLMETLLDYLESPIFHIVTQREGYDISLLPEAEYVKQLADPITACNELHYFAVIKSGFEREKESLLKSYSDEIKRTASYIQKASAKLTELQNSPAPSQLADVIMANLHHFEQGKAKIWDFYENREIEIELAPNQKPQDYAGKLYKKSKNRKIEWEQLEKNIFQKEANLEELEASKAEIESIKSARDLKKYVKKDEVNPVQKKSESPLPFKSFEQDGYAIWVGKSAKANDEMLRNHTKKNDYWLHARNVAGSHVLIKTGKLAEPPEQVLLTAAALAAYYSKSKTQSMAAVIVTQAKYVRKVKGSPAGSVMVDKEKVILVEPKSPQELF